MILSERLHAVADLVTPGLRLADIGTDHAYIPIYLVEQGRIPSAVAMDINRGPLAIAKTHIEQNGLGDKITTRLSDGLKNLKAGEVETMIIAGMGGALMIRILGDHKEVADSMKEIILQPQSEIGKVREYLAENGYTIVRENMVKDDGKYYSMMKAVKGETLPFTEEEKEFGPLLLKEAHPVLKEYLEREIKIQEQIVTSLEAGSSSRAGKRMEEIKEKINSIEQILDKYFER